MDEFICIFGVGNWKWDKYGKKFIEKIKNYCFKYGLFIKLEFIWDLVKVVDNVFFLI